MVWRMVRWVLGLYLLFAVVGRFVDGMGALRGRLLVSASGSEHLPVGVSLATSLAKRGLTPTGPRDRWIVNAAMRVSWCCLMIALLRGSTHHGWAS